MNVSLRPVRDDELALLATVLAELDDTAPMPLDALRSQLAAVRARPGYDCYFAELDGQIIGSISLNVFPVLAHNLAAEAIAESVVIRPAFRGKGLGRAMMQAALAHARVLGAYKLALSSNLRRLDAHRFYDGMGFTRHGYSFSIDTTPA